MNGKKLTSGCQWTVTHECFNTVYLFSCEIILEIRDITPLSRSKVFLSVEQSTYLKGRR